MTVRRILSIGQCGADHSRFPRAFRDHFNAEVVSADDEAEASQQLHEGPFDLILVNRVLDSSGFSGVEIIKHLKANPVAQSIPAMLVSTYDDAQEEPWECGGSKAFGKGA